MDMATETDLITEQDDFEWEAERAVGIHEFIHKESSGFQGILKHRYRDFMVQEVDLQGQVASLSDCLCDETLLQKESLAKASEESTLVDEDILKKQLSLSSLTDHDLQGIICLATKKSDATEITTSSIPNKEDRTRFHQIIRNMFKGLLQTETAGDSIKVYRRGAPLAQNGGKRDDRNFRPTGQCKYLQFILWKENMDTIDAIQLISRRLHMSAKDFTYAGTKDKRGTTMQYIVARNVTPSKILGINKLGEEKRLKISNVKMASRPLALGDLQGNRFSIVIRNISGATASKIKQIAHQFDQDGFINYFGLQRFGTTSVPSHRVGLALLLGDFAKAISLILDPREEESDEKAVAARKYWKDTGDALTAKEMFPYRYTAERQILAHYARHSNTEGLASHDHEGALMAINRELRLMYVHSVQSLLWNRMASRRFNLYGQKLALGDLVLARQSSDHNVIEITKDNIDNYSWEDLVLPVPGYRSEWPHNELGAAYELELGNLGLKVEDFKVRHNSALWDLPGTYRYVFVRPKDLSYRIGCYGDPDVDLPEGLNNEEIVDDSSQFLGLFISFTLPPSSYATMAIRELLHSGTDPRYHQRATKRHRSDVGPNT